jgi:SAM-dependent methyltransferase
MASVVEAFHRAAPGYDAEFGRNVPGRLFRHAFQERLLRLFPAGARLLDLGCGTAEDALLLASRGRVVVGLDVAPGMIHEARDGASRLGLGKERARFLMGSVEDVGVLAGGFDGAYSDFGALNCADLASVGRGLARVLRSGAPLLLSVMGPAPLPLLIRQLFTGRGEPRGGRPPRVAGVPIDVTYPTPAELRRRFGPEFAWAGGFSLGVLAPGPENDAWAGRNPQLFGMLSILESLVRGWPGLRALGDHNVLEGRRL